MPIPSSLEELAILKLITYLPAKSFHIRTTLAGVFIVLKNDIHTVVSGRVFRIFLLHNFAKNRVENAITRRKSNSKIHLVNLKKAL